MDNNKNKLKIYYIIMIDKCNKCHIENELAKGKNSCRECKNAYDRLRISKQINDKKSF